MVRLKQFKQTNKPSLTQLKQQRLTNGYALNVCECLTTRNMCRLPTGHEDVKMVGIKKKSRYKVNKFKSRKTYKSMDTKNVAERTFETVTGLDYTPTIFLALNCNSWQQRAGSLGWHLTASTAISVFATLYYLIAHTQGAAAVLDLTTATSWPTATTTLTPSSSSSSLSLSSSSSSSASLSSTQRTAANLNFFKSAHDYNSNNVIRYNNSNNNNNIYTNNNNNSINNIYSKILFDLNHKVNSTEMTISNDVSSLPANKLSDYTLDNNNNFNDKYNNVIPVYYNNAISLNDTFVEIGDEAATEYIFDRTDVRIIFITLYTMVFCCCFFGNLLVILVVTLSRRLRSITNFFLANLALADFCVGLFCVMQNLSIYLIDSWVFGEFLCRMYQFVHSLSYTASIFILVVICMERYFAIVHPITCKQILTAARLRMVILTVWITSAVYSTPKFVFSKTIKNVHTESGREEEICVLDRKMFNSKLLDMINFGLLYVIPLLVMMILYSKIAIALWRSSRGLQHHLAQQEKGLGMHNSMYQHNHNHNHNHNANTNNQQQSHHHLHNHHQQLSQQQQQQQQQQATGPLGSSISVNSSALSGAALSRKQSCKHDANRELNISDSQVSLDAERPVVTACRKTSFYKHSHNQLAHQQQAQSAASSNHHQQHQHQHQHYPQRSHAQQQGLHGSQRVSHISHSSSNVLRARRGVVRMLIIFVLTFALCNLPYHARKMWQYWSRSYRGDTNFNALLTPLTFLVTYFNSGINPLLYAFLSRNFRKGMRELLMCSWRKSKTKSSTNSSMHHKRMTLQVIGKNEPKS